MSTRPGKIFYQVFRMQHTFRTSRTILFKLPNYILNSISHIFSWNSGIKNLYTKINLVLFTKLSLKIKIIEFSNFSYSSFYKMIQMRMSNLNFCEGLSSFDILELFGKECKQVQNRDKIFLRYACVRMHLRIMKIFNRFFSVQTRCFFWLKPFGWAKPTHSIAD